jgi:hypothetical protein
MHSDDLIATQINFGSGALTNLTKQPNHETDSINPSSRSKHRALRLDESALEIYARAATNQLVPAGALFTFVRGCSRTGRTYQP